MKKRAIVVLSISFSLIVLVILSFIIYFSVYYKAVDVDLYLKSSDSVQVREVKKGYMFDSIADDKALIFYPGAKVETKAYAPLCYMLAQEGYDVFLIDMPWRFALFDINAADDIIAEYEYESYYLGGHSLGGAMAANYAAANYEKLKGLLMLASYPTKDLTMSDIKALSIYGENDGVLNRKKIEEGRKYLPKSNWEYMILGGNHAQFASYGKQKKDNDPTISMLDQIKDTINLVKKHF